MLEGVRTDVLKGPFGFEPFEEGMDYDGGAVLRWNVDVPYNTIAEASGKHGLVFEVMAFFVAPFTANYSFYVWSDNEALAM